MTRRSRERRAAAGEGDQAQAAARPAAGPPHYDADEERRLAEERKRRRIERPAAEPEGPRADWPLAPSPPASPSPASWPDAAPSSPAPRPPPPQPSPASLAQRDAIRAAEEFFSGRGASGEDGDEESEGSESEDGGDAAAGFFLGLFERDAALRGYYERSHEEGEFRCLGCVGRKRKGRGQARRFRSCAGLVHHACNATLYGRPLAHRALAAVVCRVLGWDVKRLPSIVVDPRGTLGQALLAREREGDAAATAHEAKDNVDAGENVHKYASKEDVGLEKKGSLNDHRKEDVDSRMDDAPLSDGDVAKDDVDTGKIDPPSNDNDGEVHEQETGTRTAEKYDAVKVPALAPSGGSLATGARADQRKCHNIKRPAKPEEGPDCPLEPSPPTSPSAASWPDATPSPPSPSPPQQQREPSPALLAHRTALFAAKRFFRRGASGKDGDDESEGSESEDAGDEAAGFFLGLFERGAALRGYYERSHEDGEFLCMVCVGSSNKGWGKARKFRGCVSLMYHAREAMGVGVRKAHRALAAVVCRVLGWDVKRLPSIVIDPRGTLGQALLAREGASGAATAHKAKDNVHAAENDGADAVKEDVGLEKNGSLNYDKKEDFDSIMNDGPLIDGDAAKEDVDSTMNDAPLSDGDAAKEDVGKGKIGPPSNNNDGEVHEQGNGTGTAEKEYDAVKAPAPARGSRARTDRRKRSRIERPAEPEEGPDSPLVPSPPTSWTDAPSSPASLAQQDALCAAEAFFSGRGALGEDDDGDDESEDHRGEAAGFFLGLFERDAALRGYYEQSHGEGEFLCLGCVVTNVKRARNRRFRDCASLVRHAHAATRCGRLRAHRALAAVVCRVLGWDIKRLPSIVIDPRGTLGQALLAREIEGAAAATSQEAKGNVDTMDNDVADAVKGDVGLEKNGSLNDHKKEDVDSIMNDTPLSDGNAAKDDVAAWKISPPSKDNGGEVHEQENDTRTVEKDVTNNNVPLSCKDMNDIDPLNYKDTHKELCKAAQES